MRLKAQPSRHVRWRRRGGIPRLGVVMIVRDEAELKQRYRAASDPVGRTHFQVLDLACLGWRSADIAEVCGYSPIWVRALVRRYNEGGAEALEDGRHHNPGQPRLLSSEQEAALLRRLDTPPEDGGLWSGPKVAHWMSEQLGRLVADVRGWEVLRRFGWTLQRPRRRHVEADPEAQARFQGSPSGDAPLGAAGASGHRGGALGDG